MRTAELTGALLDYWVARAEGFKPDELSMPLLKRGGKGCVAHLHDDWVGEVTRRLDYSTEWSQGGPLIEKHVGCLELDDGGWHAYTTSGYGDGETLLQAVCRALVQSKFGDEVEDQRIES